MQLNLFFSNFEKFFYLFFWKAYIFSVSSFAMGVYPFLHTLRRYLINIFTGTHSHNEVSELVSIAHSLSTAYVKRKIAMGRFSLERFSISVDQFAFDAIAEVFERDSQNTFVRLQSYFESLDIQTLSDEQILAHFQTIVFSKVNDRIMEASFENDPVYGKILRNVRLSIHSVRNFKEQEVLGEKMIVPVFCEANEHLPEIPENELLAIVAESVRYSKNIPQVLAKLCKSICEQEEYSRTIPLLKLAGSIRNAFVEVSSPEVQGAAFEYQLAEVEIRKVITGICTQLHSEMHSKYVVKRKVSSETYEIYFRVIQQKLVGRYVHLNGEADTYFELLKEHIPELTSSVYRKKQRTVLEYLAMIANDRVAAILKKEYR